MAQNPDTQPLSSYQEYIAREWTLFVADSGRADASLRAAGDLAVRRVLDVGCGAGQELLPFVKRGAFGVGADIDQKTGTMRCLLGNVHVSFIRCRGEELPFASDSFDLAVCRVALPYMDNVRALIECSRVLRQGGRLLLKVHSFRYYLRKALAGIAKRRLLSTAHAIRVIVAGVVYHVAQRQVRSLTNSETFQSEWLLRRELRKAGLVICGRMPDDNPSTPSFVICKRPDDVPHRQRQGCR